MTTLLTALFLILAADDPNGKIDNDSVRVLKALDQPHKPGALHRHAVNRVMIYLNSGDQEIRYQDGHGVQKNHWEEGQVAWSPAGGLHISENVGSKPLRIVEVELKKPPSEAPTRDPKLDPIAIDPSHNTLLFENSQVRVFRSIREPGGTEMMHQHAGTGRVGVFLTDLNGTVKTTDGVTTPINVKAGDVTWSGPVTHATTNLGPNKLEMIVIEVF